LAVEKRKAQATFTATCHYCKSEFLTTNKKQKYCQTSCRLDYQRNLNAEKTRLYYKTLYPDGLKHKICDWCNEELIVPAQKTLASRRYHEDCSVEAQRARYRIKTVKRQSKTTKPSRLAADQVLREYGSKCHICKEEIDLSLPRTSRMGLTVDHLMPLSKGGSDELDNLRPAHWICNNRKSDKIDAESW
jgi:5-methylcytosine-specific restriction endonuclease McrA